MVKLYILSDIPEAVCYLEEINDNKIDGIYQSYHERYPLAYRQTPAYTTCRSLGSLLAVVEHEKSEDRHQSCCDGLQNVWVHLCVGLL